MCDISILVEDIVDVVIVVIVTVEITNVFADETEVEESLLKITAIIMIVIAIARSRPANTDKIIQHGVQQ